MSEMKNCKDDGVHSCNAGVILSLQSEIDRLTALYETVTCSLCKMTFPLYARSGEKIGDIDEHYQVCAGKDKGRLGCDHLDGPYRKLLAALDAKDAEIERLKTDLALRGEGYDPEKTASVGRRLAEYLSKITHLESRLLLVESDKKDLADALGRYSEEREIDTERERVLIPFGVAMQLDDALARLTPERSDTKEKPCEHENGAWFDRTIRYAADGTEFGMVDRCNDCGEVMP